MGEDEYLDFGTIMTGEPGADTFVFISTTEVNTDTETDDLMSSGADTAGMRITNQIGFNNAIADATITDGASDSNFFIA
jgi:hypothetical protein